MAERPPLAPAIQERVQRFIAVSEEIDVITAQDSDERSHEFWVRTEDLLFRMAEAAGAVAAAIDEAGPGAEGGAA